LEWAEVGRGLVPRETNQETSQWKSFHVKHNWRLPQKGRGFRMGIQENVAESGLKTGKISTESPFCSAVTRSADPATKALLC
jgi:hypothetical protein